MHYTSEQIAEHGVGLLRVSERRNCSYTELRFQNEPDVQTTYSMPEIIHSYSSHQGTFPNSFAAFMRASFFSVLAMMEELLCV